MAKMCPMSGCQKKAGFCAHEIMMMGMAAMGMIVAGAHWALHLF